MYDHGSVLQNDNDVYMDRGFLPGLNGIILGKTATGWLVGESGRIFEKASPNSRNTLLPGLSIRSH